MHDPRLRVPTLKGRIGAVTLVVAALALAGGGFALHLGYGRAAALRQVLQRSRLRIRSAERFREALDELDYALPGRDAGRGIERCRTAFEKWRQAENEKFGDPGELRLRDEIERRARRLLAPDAGGRQSGLRRDEIAGLRRLLDRLVKRDQVAMFEESARAGRLARRLSEGLGLALAALLLGGAALAWGLARAVVRPLTELAVSPRRAAPRAGRGRVGPQGFAELQALARQFNQMAERLKQYEELNVERLLYEKNKTEAIIESLEDGVVLVDAGGVVTHINEIAALIMNLEPGEALGSPFDDLSTNQPHYLKIRDALRELRRARPQLRRVEVELHVRGRDHYYLLKPAALRGRDGTLLGTLLVLQDVTHVRDQDRARVNLVATLSHELRTPLTSLALSAELLEREAAGLDPHPASLIRSILEECARMRQLSDNLLSLARGELASIALQREPLDFCRVVGEVTDRFVLQAQAKGVRLEKQVGPVPLVKGDPLKLSWVLSNLIGNALRYTPAAGRIVVGLRQLDGAVRLEVSDTGPGIAPEIRARIFERFTQYAADGSAQGLAGLGLAIVKEIVEAHRGRIYVDSAVGAGSRFIVELPAGGYA